VIAHDLGKLWRRLVVPKRVDTWSLTTLQQRLLKTGRRLIRQARYDWLLLAEGQLTRRLSGAMLQRVAACYPRQRDNQAVDPEQALVRRGQGREKYQSKRSEKQDP
jgi:hypothetical protein